MDHDDSRDGEKRAVHHRPMVGIYRLDVASGTWWWSDDAYRIHGFNPGDAIPTTDLLIARLRGADVDEAEAEAELRSVGHPFSFSRQVIAGHGEVRTVLVTGQVTTDLNTGVEIVTGYFIDLSDVQEDVAARTSSADASASAVRRTSIEQAKGLIMMSHQMGEPDASELLHSRAVASDLHLHDLSFRLLDFFQRAPKTKALSSGAVDRYLRSPSQARRPDPLAPPRPGEPGEPTLYRLVDSDGRELLRPSKSLDDIVDVVKGSGLPMRDGREVFIQQRRGEQGWRLRSVE